MSADSQPVLNKFSSRITQPRSQGASQAMLYATGMTEEDMNKAQVGISSVWYEGNSCNMHLNKLAAKVKEGVEAAGLVGLRFNTIGVSDGISMGTDGMSYSLQSRDLIADSIETVTCAQWYDANISLPGCDKNMPGCLIAMGRFNRPSIMVYGGTIAPGCLNNQNTWRVPLPMKPEKKSYRKAVPAPVPAAACIPPTPCHPPSKHWGCRSLTVLPFLQNTRTNSMNVSAPVPPLRSCWNWI